VKSTFKSYLSLILWIVALEGVSTVIGYSTKTEVDAWYGLLNRSPLTPPNYVFPVAWTLLYGLIAASGWIIWRAPTFPRLNLIKILYVVQLVLNWTWTPLFFHYGLTGTSLVSLLLMDIIVLMMICLGYARARSVSLLLTPYVLWILFATYLNFYIWQHN